MTTTTAAANNPTLPAPLNQNHPKTQADWQQILNQLQTWQNVLGIIVPPMQQTDAERTAGVTPTNYGYAPGILDRYGPNTVPGTTDMTAVFVAAAAVWAAGGPPITLLPTTYYIASNLTLTVPIVFQSRSRLAMNPSGTLVTLNGPVTAPMSQIFNQSGTTGGVAWANANTITGAGYTGGTYTNVPLTGGSGTGAVATIQVFGTHVFNVIITSPGSGYHSTDTLSAATANIGGTGSGFGFTPFLTQIAGSFGGDDIYDCWFGTVADGNGTTGAGTDNTAAFQAALNCVVLRNAETEANGVAGNRLVTLAGSFRCASQICVGDNIHWLGAGRFNSILFAPTAFANLGGLIAMNGQGTLPTLFSDFSVGGQSGGCGGRGIVVTKNAGSVENVWVTSFTGGGSAGIQLSQTSVYLRNFVAELNSTGIYITQAGITISDGETFNNFGQGFLIQNSGAASTARVTINSVRCAGDLQSGVNCLGAAHVSLTDVHAYIDATNAFTSGAFLSDVTSNDITYTGCTARVSALGGTTGAGFNLNGTNITVTGCASYSMSAGLVSGVSGLYLSGGVFSGNSTYGIHITGGDQVNLTGFTAGNNGSDGCNVNASTANSKIQIGSCLTSNNAAWGLNLAAISTSYINVTGNASNLNTSGAINKSGTVANINVVGNF